MTNFNQKLLHTSDEVVQQSLSLPLLSYSDLPQYRRQLTLGLKQYSTAINAIFLGMQSATPGMAFLSGYQNAIRCLDPKCPADVLAAFCVSEKGIKKPWDMQTQIIAAVENSAANNPQQSYCLTGQKGYVMLLPDDLDRLYVIAKDESKQLRCVYLSSRAAGLTITEPLKAPFIQDIPHTGVGFAQVDIPASQLMPIDGHQQANKPFRYWEDIHVTLAMMAWMFRAIVDAGGEKSDTLLEAMNQLVTLITQSPEYYSLESFSIFEACQGVLESSSKGLSKESLQQWQADQPLLLMGQKIRRLIQAKMAP